MFSNKQRNVAEMATDAQSSERTLLSMFIFPMLRPLVLIILCVASFFFGLVWLERQSYSNKAKPTDELDGTYDVVTIEANGEKHEYLKWVSGYRGGIEHLPNCKFCNGEEK